MPGELIALARYLENHEFGEYETGSDIIDFGFRALYNINRASISAEFVQRNVADRDAYNRLAGILEYKISDNLYITGTFDQDFDPERGILVRFGLNVGISGKTSLNKRSMNREIVTQAYLDRGNKSVSISRRKSTVLVLPAP